jgi:hypothetical protein
MILTKKTVIVSLNSTESLVFVLEAQCVFCEENTEFLNTQLIQFMLTGLFYV